MYAVLSMPFWFVGIVMFLAIPFGYMETEGERYVSMGWKDRVTCFLLANFMLGAAMTLWEM